jgi:dTMP kinase
VSTFITFEGIEGSGKTTQAKRLADRVRGRLGMSVLLTREPGGTEVTEQIRSLLADPQSQLDARAELLLFLADRAQHVATVIRPALERGEVVICDRYIDSTIAYQSYGRGHDYALLCELNAWASRDLMPDLTLWIDLDVETGLGRAVKRTGGPGDRFESEPLDYHRRVRRGFAEQSERFPERIVRIDGDRDEDAVFASVCEATERRLR